MKQKLLIIDVNPFGALTDSVKWVKYLKNDWDITMICFAAKNGSKANAAGFKLIQLKNFEKRQIKALWFLLYTIIYLIFFKGKIVVEYFPTCEIYKKLFPWKRMLVDIRTLSVSKEESVRTAHNKRLIKACSYFDKVTAISEGVAQKIGLSEIEILPLGSDVISATNKVFTDRIRLIYVGTFTNRQIERTIKGVVSFRKAHPDIPIDYKIIGYGVAGEELLFKNMITEYDANDYIHLIGKVPHDKLSTYFDLSNVGLSFVPITDYYNDQPPTKTYEYCLSGIYCIATATRINKNLINKRNGMLIDDTVESVKKGIEYFWINRDKFNSTEIRNSLQACTWKNIVINKLSPILKSL